MKRNLEKVEQDLNDNKDGLENIYSDIRSVELVLNRIMYIKSHAMSVMFKDAIVIKKQRLTDETIKKGSICLEKLIRNAMEHQVNQ